MYRENNDDDYDDDDDDDDDDDVVTVGGLRQPSLASHKMAFQLTETKLLKNSFRGGDC